ETAEMPGFYPENEYDLAGAHRYDLPFHVLLFKGFIYIYLRAASPPCCASIVLSIGLARLSVNNFAAFRRRLFRPSLSLPPETTCRFSLYCGFPPLPTVFAAFTK
ncbi:hypothetical protein, partial [Acutalibacter muris]|uniref:hypothetical protein n=1 Tax=Acutalibacter muris TaxID=1796620 RepID=UPI00272E852B